MAELRKYGAQTTFNFPLVDRDAVDFEATPVAHAAGDTQVMKDEGAFANTDNAFAHEGNGIYSIVLTATEMEAARIVITIKDQGAKAWEDQSVLIDTYGNAVAEHAFDLDTASQVVASVTGAVGSVTGAVGSVTGAVGSVTGAVGSVAGNVDGNVGGTVTLADASLTAAKFGAAAITAASIAANALTNAKFAAACLTQANIVIDNTEAADAADAVSSFWEMMKYLARTGVGVNKADHSNATGLLRTYNDAGAAVALQHTVSETSGVQVRGKVADP